MRRMDVPEIVRALLRKADNRQETVADLLGVSQSTVSRWLSGKQLPDFKQTRVLETAALAQGLISPQKNGPPSTTLVKVVGFVGLGEEVDWIDTAGAMLQEIELPFPVPEQCFALEAKGDSMSPRVKNGEVVVVRANGNQPSDLLGQEAIVKLRDGPYLVKTIRRGYESGRFNLESFNAPLRENVEIEWCGELWAIIPSKRWLRTG
jgi:phage repressor protein C with HTH and peptisase S24 domain